jgi:hypothetical protein
MKNLLRLVLSDRLSMLIIVVFILTATFASITSITLRKERTINQRLRSQIRELNLLNERFNSIKGYIESKEKRIGLVKTQGVVSAIEHILNSLGMKAKAIRPIKEERLGGYILEDAEVEIQDTDLNAIVNLLYKVENSRFPLRIKETLMKTAFEDPERFTLRITVSLIRAIETGDRT